MNRQRKTDNLTPVQRRYTMSRVRSVDTGPELAVRRVAYSLGYRYRLHRRDLPGTPDLVFPRLRKVIFVHGCFWHMHRCGAGKKQPLSNRKYWADKRERNRARDVRNRMALRRLGWEVLVVWGCQLRPQERLRRQLAAFLGDEGLG